jgi:hypothetical protein
MPTANGCRLLFAPASLFVFWLMGCAPVMEALSPGRGQANTPELSADTTPERVIYSDSKWITFASGKPLAPQTRSDAPVRWAQPNYGTGGWLPALVADATDGDSAQFQDSRWIWYPQEGFVFGADNSIPDNRRVVHARRFFYNTRAKADIREAYVEIMASGKISYRVFINGFLVKTDDEAMYGRTPMERFERMRGRSMQRARGPVEIMDMVPYRYDVKDYLVAGKNVIAIEATAHVNNDVGGRPVPNHVRRGLLVKAVVE